MSQKENAKDQPQSPSTTSTASNIVLMKKGDYSIHVLIEEIKNCIQIDPERLPYPIVKITCFNNKSQRTNKPSQACTEYTYDEHFYFDQTNMSTEQIDSSKIIIEVYDSENSRKREDFLGIYEFDMEYIYNHPNHALKNFWLALANPESDDITKVRGYLKLSISVLHDNDPRVELELNDNNDSNCVLPSQINVEYRLITLNIFRGEGIPDMDSVFSEKKINRECDGYIEVKYMGITKKTSVIKMKNDVITWNEAIDIPVTVPAVSQRIVLTLYDQDVNGDDIIGSLELEVNDIVNERLNGFRFFNVYGAPLNKDGTYFDQMNTNAEIGSRWKGRILMLIEHNSVDNPISRKRKIDNQSLINEANVLSRKHLWSVYVKVYNAYYLPSNKDKYSIRIEMQDSNVQFPEKKSDNGSIEWRIFKTLQCQTLTDQINELPDLFIYLLNDSKEPICFQRIKACEFHLNSDIMIVKFIPDPCFNKVSKLCESGILKIKISIVNKTLDASKGKSLDYLKSFKDGDSNIEEDIDDLELLTKDDYNPINKNFKFYTVVANVYMSRYVIAKDSNGQNDPYVSIKCVDNEQKTSVKTNTVNGIWNEKLIFDNVTLDINNKSSWPILICKINDYDSLTKDDLLAYSYIWLSDANYAINSIDLVKPKWHQLYLPKSNRQQGEILISFYILDSNHSKCMYDIVSIPETVPYSFEINLLGLRDLKPLSLLPVKKAFIKFDMNSLNVSGLSEETLQPIKTEPKDSGSNPTINTVIKFDVKLPKEDIFMPELQCEVYDHLLSGMLNPLMGVFMLNVRKIVLETNKQIEEDLKVTKKKIGLFLTSGIIAKELNLIQQNNINNDPMGEGIPQGYNDNNNNNNKEDIMIEMTDQKGKQHKAQSARYYTQEEIEQNKNNADYFVLLPQFKTFTIPGMNKNDKSYREFEIEDLLKAPDDSDYFAVGYIGKSGFDPLDSENKKKRQLENLLAKPQLSSKHYRRIYRKGLEQVRELGLKSPFTKSYLNRGKEEDQKDENALFEAISSVDNKIIKKYSTNEKGELKTNMERKSKQYGGRHQQRLKNDNFGCFKGVIRICEKNKLKEYEKVISDFKKDNPSLVSLLKNLNKYETLTRNILIKNEVIVRLYVLELNDLVKKDKFNDSDPYIKIYLGDELKYNEQSNRLDDVKNCKWCRYYDIQSILPGDSTLTLEVWDYDPVFADEMIGSTSIDLEDRYFSQEWKEMKYKPIEIRTLRHPDMSSVQGSVYLWLEIFEKKDRIEMEPWMIQPEPQTYVEMRLVIWETENIRTADIEGTSDLYVNAYIQPESKQSTDVHYRCTTGIGSFNWRMVFPLYLPKDNKILTLHVYDKDIFKRNDFLCGTTLDLRDLMSIAKDLDIPISLTKAYIDGCSENQKRKYEGIEFISKSEDPTQTKFWLQLYNNNQKDGRVLCSVEILPQWKADITKVGKGRSEPNVSPYLPPPVGRFEFSLNPFKTLNQCVGPSFRRKMYCGICISCLILYLMCIVPYVILHLTGELANPFNWFGMFTKK